MVVVGKACRLGRKWVLTRGIILEKTVVIKTKRFILAALIAFLCLPAGIVFARQAEEHLQAVKSEAEIKNIILFIGDGMGISQVASASIKSLGAEKLLYMERMPVTGLLYTYSASALVTDSAAASTALATGYTTNKGMISINPGGRRVVTILEACRDKGMATGLVATYAITHATPAGFASHVISRNDQQEIAAQYLQNRVDVLLGGGRQFFLPQSASGSARKDDNDLISKAMEMGYLYVQSKEELMKARTGRILGLFALSALSSDPEPSLAVMAEKSISILSRNEKGFFLMVEGSQIDRAGHANDMDNTILQTLLFDEAVKAGLDFALENRETLVIVTADHETGGLGINAGNLDGKNLTAGWTTRSHTAVPVPLFAFGPGAERFTGVKHLTDVPKIIAELLHLQNFPRVITEK